MSEMGNAKMGVAVRLDGTEGDLRTSENTGTLVAI